MNKDDALQEFLKGLRISFNNALAYSRNHPYFIKSVEDFKSRIELLFNFVKPVNINIGPDYLLLEGKKYTVPAMYSELAQFFHQRKIKSIELRPGVSVEELADLLSILALSPKDIIKNGGLTKLLNKKDKAYIVVEELDYSALLDSQGAKSPGDLWSFIFREEGSFEGGSAEVNSIADNFTQEINKIDFKNLMADEKARGKLDNFFDQLRKIDEAKYFKCLGELVKYSQDNTGKVSGEALQYLKSLFCRLSEEDSVSIIAMQLRKEDSSNSLLVNLFSLVSQSKDPFKIVTSLSNEIKSGVHATNRKLASKKIQELLVNSQEESVSPVYQNVLSSLLKQVSFSEGSIFDAEDLHLSFCYVLLNILSQEDDDKKIKSYLMKIDKELVFLYDNNDFDYFKNLIGVTLSKINTNPALAQELSELNSNLFALIEDRIWEAAGYNPRLESLVNLIDKSSRGSAFYLKNIFEHKNVNPLALGLFIRLFPGALSDFYSELENNREDRELLERIINSILSLSLELSLAVLKNIYYSSGPLIRLEILDSMGKMGKIDRGLFFSALKENNRTMRKKALLGLSNEKESLREGLNILFNIRSPFGRKNNILLENMGIIEELGLKEAGKQLSYFTKLKLLWHRPLKKRAIQLIEALK